MIPNVIFPKRIFKLASMFPVLICVQAALYAGKNDDFASKTSEVISSFPWIQERKVESTKKYYDVIKSYYHSPAFKKLPKARTAHTLFKKIETSDDTETGSVEELGQPQERVRQRKLQLNNIGNDELESSSSSSEMGNQLNDFIDVDEELPALPIEIPLIETGSRRSTTDSDSPVENDHNGPGVSLQSHARGQDPNESSDASPGTDPQPIAAGGPSMNLQVDTGSQGLSESGNISNTNLRADPQPSMVDNNGASGSDDNNDGSNRQVPQPRGARRTGAVSRTNTAPNASQTGDDSSPNQGGNRSNQIINQRSAAVGQQAGQQNIQQNVPQIARTNRSQRILDTSHEHTFVARNIARLIHAEVGCQMRENMLGNTGKEISSANANSLWAKGMYGHSHKTSPGLPHNDNTTGVLVGYNRMISDWQTIGVFAGYSDTDINYKGSYRGTYGEQKSWTVGACTSIQPNGGRLILSNVFLVNRNTYSDNVKHNSQQQIAESRTKYHGISCSNKMTAGLLYQKGDHVLSPEFAVSLDYVTQKKHAHVSPNGALARENKLHDLFITCSCGIRYTQRSNKNIQPSIFLGYEWTAIRKIGTRSADKNLLIRSSRVNGDHAILDARLNFKIADQMDLALGYIGNYGKHYTFSGAQLSLARQF